MYEEADCGYGSCPRCRPKLSDEEIRRRALAEHKRRLKSGEWVDGTEYAPDERLTSQRIAAARRRGMR
jgi:hypothetical protein